MTTTDNNVIANYTNGNYSVVILNDGTKIREFTESPKPVHPESIDVKITNFCEPVSDNPICAFCHEKSGLNGKHADLDKLYQELSLLPPGVEIAMGGGNPLSHPDLLDFLGKLKSAGLIVNMTVNQKHLNKYHDLLSKLITEKLINGVGISYSQERYFEDIRPLLKLTDNMVFHVIMGINSVHDLAAINSFCMSEGKTAKVLILGYKQYGFGLNYYVKNSYVEENKNKWYMFLSRYFNNNNLILSFDNLAISQLNLKRFFTSEGWSMFYMGDDGVFTCYIDGVEQVFAKSSTSSNRSSFSDDNILTYFKSLSKGSL